MALQELTKDFDEDRCFKFICSRFSEINYQDLMLLKLHCFDNYPIKQISMDYGIKSKEICERIRLVKKQVSYTLYHYLYLNSIDIEEMNSMLRKKEYEVAHVLHRCKYITNKVLTVKDEDIRFLKLTNEEPYVVERGIEELKLTNRSYNCLKRYGIQSIIELSHCSFEQLTKIRDLGKKSLIEIITVLKEHDVYLHHDKHDKPFFKIDFIDNI